MVGTIEFFPEEGKYHADGHRLCGVRFTPEETKQHGGICPVCGKPLVVGVNYRVGELAERPVDYLPATPKQTEYIIPLAEIIAELKNVKSVSSQTVTAELQKIYAALGDEFSILRNIPLEQIREAGFISLALALERMRSRDVVLEPGYDGVFGIIKVFKDYQERQASLNQLSLL